MKIITYVIMGLLLIGFASAISQVSCNNGAVNAGQNPNGKIVLCDDPNDLTCEQDFETLCPTNYDLCNYVDYNINNDDWAGDVPTWLLGEITCRAGTGAGHFTITHGAFATDVANNQIAGSSLPQCQEWYGCNEQQYYALCCYSGSGSSGGSGEDPQEVPEFGVIAGAIALIGALGIFAYTRRD